MSEKFIKNVGQLSQITMNSPHRVSFETEESIII